MIQADADDEHIELVGRKTRDGWSVKMVAVAEDENENVKRARVLLSRAQGYDFKNRWVSVEHVRAMLPGGGASSSHL